MKTHAALELSAGTRFALSTRMKKFFIKYTPAISSYLLSALFLYAAYYKLKTYSTFVTQLSESPITKGYEHMLAWLVPGTEIVIALLLLFPRTRLAGLYSSFMLMFAFTLYVYKILTSHGIHACGCGGIISAFTWKQHLWFNTFFTFLPALAVYMLSLKKTHSLN